MVRWTTTTTVIFAWAVYHASAFSSLARSPLTSSSLSSSLWRRSPPNQKSSSLLSSSADNDDNDDNDAAATISTTATKKKHCVVVGGGPVGLAAALTLSRPPHSYNVTVLEQSRVVQSYDPTRAYLYNINQRGLEWVDQYQKATTTTTTTTTLLNDLLTSGYMPLSGMGNFIQIAADPAIPIVHSNVGTFAGNMSFDERRRSVWIPRHQMVQVLLGTCDQHNQHVNNNSTTTTTTSLGHINVQHGKCVAALVDDRDDCVEIQCQDGSTYEATLVVAADGIDSKVRGVLAGASSSGNDSRWLQSRPDAFRVRSYPSPSAGLKLKCLQFPPNFTLDNTDGSLVESISTNIYVFRSTLKAADGISLGCLPVKDPTLVRPANINTRPDHVVWSIRDGPAMKTFMTQAFPRLPWDRLVDDTEWERFAQARGTTYPRPQYSPGSVVTSPYNPNVAVVMVGDACHAFPPDIGQGINAGLNDVLVLDRCLQGQDVVSGKPTTKKAAVPSLAQALATYQANRGPEHAALIRLARFGAPYQYRQSWLRDRIGAKLWTLNAVVRILLNKISFGIIPPIALVMASQTRDTPWTFRQLMRKADRTSFLLTLTVVVIVPLAIRLLRVVGA